MKKIFYLVIVLVFVHTIRINCQNSGIKISEFNFELQKKSDLNLKEYNFDFKGYTDHWDEYSYKWYNYNGIFQTSQNTISSEIKQMEMAIGNNLILEELWIEKGFVNLYNKSKPVEFKNLKKESEDKSLESKDIIICGTDRDSIIAGLVKKLPEELQYRRNRAFYVTKEGKKIFVIACHTKAESEKLSKLILNAAEIINKYNLYKGYAGVHLHYLLITQHPQHPVSFIDESLKMGCSWMMVSGYNDKLLNEPTNKMISEVSFPFLFLPGQYVTGGVMYGSNEFPDVQDNNLEQCLEWKTKNNSLYYSYLSGIKNKNSKQFSGYIVTGSNDQKKIDSLQLPFITEAGIINNTAPPSMILFIEKNKQLNQKSIIEAIQSRNSVAVFDKADMVGDEKYKNCLRILLLEQEYLESVFMKPLTITSKLESNQLKIKIENNTNEVIQGNLVITTDKNVKIGDNLTENIVKIEAKNSKTISFAVAVNSQGCGEDHPVKATIYTNNNSINHFTHFEIPEIVNINPLIVDAPGRIDYPATIWNNSLEKKVDVKLELFTDKNNKLAYTEIQSVNIDTWQKGKINFKIPIDSGLYTAKVSALNASCEGIISIIKNKESAKVYSEDQNKDSIPEIVMENSKIKATIILNGGRIIEYILKSKDENLLFKLWPNKPPWDGTPAGFRAFYPYGGLEEFIGYPFIGGQIIYNYKIEKDKGEFVRVRVWANIHGSKVEKIITLFADSELLEVRYTFDDMDENIPIIGINPLIQIGPSTGPEDIYYFPAEKIEKRSPVLDRYYGNTFHLKEGWVAGLDTILKLGLIVGYPVNNAMLMHLWNNHPDNKPTPYFYTELQPWIKMKKFTTTYFSYYLYAFEGDWNAALSKFKQTGAYTKVKP